MGHGEGREPQKTDNKLKQDICRSTRTRLKVALGYLAPLLYAS